MLHYIWVIIVTLLAIATGLVMVHILGNPLEKIGLGEPEFDGWV